MNHCLIFI